jgi:glycerate kinase
VIEMAAASGLHLLRPEQYDPMKTTTYGTGELIREAIDAGARKIILGIGGSATTDGGLGCLVGAMSRGDERLWPRSVPLVTGEGLVESADTYAEALKSRTEPHALFHQVEIIVACDVSNPLYGPNGAAHVYGPQKGATPVQVEILDDALRRLSRHAEALARRPGAGAAGGLGFGMMAFFGAELRSGFEIVAEAVGLRERVAAADLVITGEGRLDASSLSGKTAIGVARACKAVGKPCVALVGSVGEGAERAVGEGIGAYFSICDGPMDLGRAMREAPRLLEQCSENVIRLVTNPVSQRSLGGPSL